MCEAKLTLLIAVPTVRIEGSTPPGEAKNFAAVVPVIRISANTRNGRSDYLSKMPIDTAYRNSAIPGSLYMSKE